MQIEKLITVSTPYGLVWELGTRNVDAWWMRPRNGVQGLEGVTAEGSRIRLELQEPELEDYADAAE